MAQLSPSLFTTIITIEIFFLLLLVFPEELECRAEVFLCIASIAHHSVDLKVKLLQKENPLPPLPGETEILEEWLPVPW